MLKKKDNKGSIWVVLTAILFVFSICFMFGVILYINNEVKTEDTKAAEEKVETEEIVEEKVIEEEVVEEEEELSEEELLEQEIDSILSQMTLEDKVSQLFVVTPEALTGVDVAVQVGDTTKQALQNYPVGGVIWFSQNMENEEQLRKMLSDYKANSKYPLFTSVDEEGGSLVARVANSGVISVPTVSDMQVIGSTQDPQQAYEVGVTLGTYLHDLGFNLNFAPVADVASNPYNTVIGVRSFGADSELVSKMVAEEVKGMQEQGVSATLKHFPGHGDTQEDSHTESAVSYKTFEELKTVEFKPFESGIEAGTDLIMAGHISLPEVTGDSTPATLSKKIITDCLRGELGFEGIVITDAMNMGAIVNYYDSAQSAVLALEAGCDMILMPSDFMASRQAVIDAVGNGTLTEERINESLKRIYRVKLKYNE